MNHRTKVRRLTRGIGLPLAAVLLAALAHLACPPPVAHAAVINVTTANDELDGGAGNGACSLREAITNANTNNNAQVDCAAGTAALDTITFDPGLDPIVLTIEPAGGNDDNANGDLDILDGGDLTVQGNGAANTIVDGNDIDRVFHVCPGGSCSSTVTFHAVTIRNGRSAGGSGILNSGATLNVQNSTVGGAGGSNWAAFMGGGIYNYEGTTTLDASTVSANTAMGGGGIYNRATLIVRNGSSIGGADQSAIDGGGIYNYDGITTVDASTVSANTASDGGGIHNWGLLVVRNGSTIGGPGAGNQAIDAGGGIYTSDSATVEDSTVNANTATDGGGIYSTRDSTTTVENSTVSANVAEDGGGGIYNIGTTTVEGGALSDNRANYGGGAHNSGTLTIHNGTTIGGAGTGNRATNRGGGVYNTVNMTVTDSRILHNTADIDGGGLYSNAPRAGAAAVTDSCIAGNSQTSFCHSGDTQQIATHNWWGAADGPNAPGADTASDTVDTSDFLTEPILGCTPDLRVVKGNDTGGQASVGRPFTWMLTVSNTGDTNATFLAGQRILEDDLPPGPAYGLPVPGSFISVTHEAAIECNIVASTLSCQATVEEVTITAGTGRFVVSLPVTPGAAGTLSNPAGICRVDPNGHVDEGDEGNNNCSPDTVDVATGACYLPLVLRNAP